MSIPAAESLRSPDNACEADPRNIGFVINSMEGSRPYALKDHHDSIANLELHAGVPEEIRIHFETTKNLYLYCWFVYRFYPVALHYSFVSLEFALRRRFEEEMVADGEKKRDHGPGLRELLKHAIENRHLRNENFQIWRHQTELRARMRTSEETIKKMMRENLTELEYDENAFEITDSDRDHDLLMPLLENYPNIRNHYAHGSRSLSNHALSTIQIVSEIINQIFASNE